MPYLTLSKAEVDQLLGTPREHLVRLGAKARDRKLYFSDMADPKELPQDTYWQTSLAVAIKQAQQYLDAPDSSPRRKRQAQATIERARATAIEERAQQIKHETASITALKAFTRFESYASQYQSYVRWAQALQAADSQAWTQLKGELDRLEPEVQAVLGGERR